MSFFVLSSLLFTIYRVLIKFEDIAVLLITSE